MSEQTKSEMVADRKLLADSALNRNKNRYEKALILEIDKLNRRVDGKNLDPSLMLIVHSVVYYAEWLDIYRHALGVDNY